MGSHQNNDKKLHTWHELLGGQLILMCEPQMSKNAFLGANQNEKKQTFCGGQIFYAKKWLKLL